MQPRLISDCNLSLVKDSRALNITARGSRVVRTETRRKKWWLFNAFYYKFRSLNDKDNEMKRVPQGAVDIQKYAKKIGLLPCFVWNFRILFQVDEDIKFRIIDRFIFSLFLLIFIFLLLYFFTIYIFFFFLRRKQWRENLSDIL